AAGAGGRTRAERAQAGPDDRPHGATLSAARTLALVESAARNAAPTPLAPGMRDLARIESRCRSVSVSAAREPPDRLPLQPPSSRQTTIRSRIMAFILVPQVPPHEHAVGDQVQEHHHGAEH